MGAANAHLPGLEPTAKSEGPGRSADPGGGTGLIRIDPKVLDDLSHELGNFFHKLYYWSDYIRSGADDLGPESSASHMLDRTIHHLEEFLKVAMDYFQPIRLSCVKVTAAELKTSVEGLLRAELGSERAEISSFEGARDMALMIDPTRLTGALRIAVRQIRSGSSLFGVRAKLRRVKHGGVDGLEVEIDAPAGTTEVPPRRAAQLVEWAVAKKFVEMHGGELSTREQHGASSCVLFLPLCS